MKKIYIFFCLVCLNTFCISQSLIQKDPSLLRPKQFIYNKPAFAKNPVAKTSTIINQGWFNYGRAAESFWGTSSEINANYLFPDSLGYGEFNAGIFEPCWVHHLAELVDFRSVVFSFDPSTNWMANSNATFAIDSMSLYYAYTRNHPNPNIIDTLIVTLFDNSNSANMLLKPLIGVTAANFGTDTLSFELLGYNPLNNVIAMPTNTTVPQNTPSGQYQFKVLLAISDTSLSFKEKKFNLPIPFSSISGKLIVADIMFKPGYSYALGDHISTMANAFYFASLEENGGGTFMNHMDCGFGSNLCDNSMSYIVSKELQYNMAPNGWNYHYIPSVAYTAPYLFEHHQITFHLTDSISCSAHSQFSVIPDTITPGSYSAYNNSWGTGTLSYLWDFGDGNTSTLQYPSHQYAVPGQYIVCLTVSANTGSMTCSDYYCDSSSVQKPAGFLMSQFNVIPQIVTNIKQTETNLKISAYPNPIADQLIMEASSADNNKLTYTLIDALGRTVLTGNMENSKAILNTSSLEKGFYSLSLSNEKGTALKTVKLVK